ncbi:MAG: TonB-dependent receptor [Deltaproteobacteria bacterium]|nr:TonB-dependent receptor [Deltaproteobacteria bacterium]
MQKKQLNRSKAISRFHCIASLLLLCAVFIIVPNGLALGSDVIIDIPSQKAAAALRSFAQQTGLSLMYAADDIGDSITQEVYGNYSPIKALELMLKDTGLVVDQASAKTITIKRNHHQAQVETKSKADASKASDKKAQALPDATQAKNTDKANQPSDMAKSEEEKTEGESYDDYILENTVVTASKREVRIQNIPMSIQALTGETLEKIGSDGFEDFIYRIPGLTINVGSNGFNSLQIRGISAIADSPTASATVGFYIDDTPISSALQAPDAALFDLERIEVLKGPQGTLYGEGSLGGTVRLITRKPEMNEFEGKIQLTGSKTENSSGYSYKTNALVNVPLIDDKLALRVSGSHNNDDGFVDDANSGDEGTNSYRKSNIRATFRFEPFEKLSISPTFIYQKIDGGSPAYDSPLYPDLTWFRELPYNEDFGDEYKLFALTFEYNLGWAELTSNTSYYDRDLTLLADASLTNNSFMKPFLAAVFGLDSPFIRTDGASQTETFTQELRLVSTAKGPFSWVFGGFYRDRENGDQWHLPSAPLLLGTGNETIFAFDVMQTAEQIAVFGDVNYAILDNLILTGGARWFREEIEGNSLYQQIFLNPFNPFELVSGRTQSEVTDDDVLFKLALAYNPVDNMMLYTQFTQGIRPGGTNERSADFGFGQRVDPTFDSDSTNNYEAGIKSDWFDGRLRINAAYYYIDWQDVQVSDVGEIGQSFIINASEARSTGFEMELLTQPVYGLTLGLNLNYSIEAEITEETATARGTIPNGAPLPWSPELSGSAFAEYAFPIRQGLMGYAGADVQFMDEQFVQTQTGLSSPTALDGYETVNLHAGVTAANWGVQILVSNVTDELAELDVYPYPAFGFYRNRPRTISLQFTANF